MHQPTEYRVEYIVRKGVPYRNADPNAKGTHASNGIFHEGRVVWLVKPIGEDAVGDVPAYADGAGLVLVNCRSLKPC